MPYEPDAILTAAIQHRLRRAINRPSFGPATTERILETIEAVIDDLAAFPITAAETTTGEARETERAAIRTNPPEKTPQLTEV